MENDGKSWIPCYPLLPEMALTSECFAVKILVIPPNALLACLAVQAMMAP